MDRWEIPPSLTPGFMLPVLCLTVKHCQSLAITAPKLTVPRGSLMASPFLPAAKPTGLGEHFTVSSVVRRHFILSGSVAQAGVCDFPGKVAST